jgi:2-polyprenyl-3-methyl-5-hydroxy-6-metoxy-1,4-benzoquinol methylase
MWTEVDCPICESKQFEVIHHATVEESSFTVETFSARRLPDRQYYQWVRCNNCHLLRSNPVQDIDLKSLYQESTFDYSEESIGLAKTYVKVVKNALGRGKTKGSLLEVGGGNGFFLDEALASGFSSIDGVEPSIEAVSKASEKVRPHIKTSMLMSDLYSAESFDVVTMFHVLDHLPNPLETLNLCIELLKPGGTFVVAVHNERSFSARLLGAKSPIFDVEHTFLYSKRSAKKLFEKAGFENIKAHSYSNNYRLRYLIHLLPIPRALKISIIESEKLKKILNIKVIVPLGNMWVSGDKSEK